MSARNFVATLSSLAVAATALVATGQAAQAAPQPKPLPTGIAAANSGELAHVDVLSTSALPLGPVSITEVGLGHVTGSLTDGPVRSRATAVNLDASLLTGIDLSQILSTATQTAPADNPTPTDGVTIPAFTIPPVAGAGVSSSTAHARWTNSCLPAATKVSTSRVTTADAEVLTVPGLGALVNLPGTVYVDQSTTLAAAGRALDARAVSSSTSSNIADINLFGDNVHIAVSKDPVLTATASGVAGGASVEYSQPVLTVGVRGQADQVLDAANDSLVLNVPDNPLLKLKLSLGAIENGTAAADGTAASGHANLLDIELGLGPVDVAKVALVP
ncbi:MAG: hypothetical protein EOO74_05300, partial [Myxococcales bacterium]